MTDEIVYAEDVPYFQTSQQSADTWMDKAKKEITSIGGKILAEAYGSDATGRSAFMLAFEMPIYGVNSKFKITWPVLTSKKGNARAAKVQAATALYHDVKARVVTAKFQGIKGAFFSYFMLPNGTTASEAAADEFMANVPQLMSGSKIQIDID